MKFVDVKNDVAFHRIFGNANKTVALISFLNAVMGLEGENCIASVTIENPYLYAPSNAGKTVVIDVRAIDQKGRHFIVEMQVADKEGFEKRAQFYASRDYAVQISRGEQYAQLRPTHFIGILDFDFSDNPHYFSHHQTTDKVTGQCLLKDIQYFFIELPKFKKTLAELENMMDRWTFFIKNAENLNVIPSDVTDEGLKTAYIEADQHNWTKVQMDLYIDAGALVADRIQERIKSEKIGKEIGMNLGKEIGKEIGLEIGMKKGKMEIARNLKEMGFSVADIVKATGLSVKEIEEL